MAIFLTLTTSCTAASAAPSNDNSTRVNTTVVISHGNMLNEQRKHIYELEARLEKLEAQMIAHEAGKCVK
ncbi:hypothetical protein HON52_02685 [Candidatus Uhrbacteria bacterium]|nr:hypothetical protein [Candidatus Uhrbacteria bacterium]